MSTTIRPELSGNNKYWIDKHRYYELKHFCLQYPFWKKMYVTLNNTNISMPPISRIIENKAPGDPTLQRVLMKHTYYEKMRLVERITRETDVFLNRYLLKAVTEGVSYTYLKTQMDIPCGKDMYYDRYRRFFWMLDKERD